MARRVVRFLGLFLLVAAPAAAEDPAPAAEIREETDREVRREVVTAERRSAAKPFDTRPRQNPGRWSLVESELVPADRTTSTPAHWTGDATREREDPAVEAERERGSDFVQPFLLPSVRPQFAFLIGHAAGSGDVAGAELDQVALLSLYYVEAIAPLLTVRDGVGTSSPSWRVNGKLPLVESRHHALTFGAGVLLPVRGRLTDGGGYNSWLGYAFGAGLLSAQARFGLGIDRPAGDLIGDPRALLFYDAVAGARLLPWLQVLAQVDGSSGVGRAGATLLRIMPGVRAFPLRDGSLTLGAAFLGWFEKQADWSTRRLGVTVDLGYIFL